MKIRAYLLLMTMLLPLWLSAKSSVEGRDHLTGDMIVRQGTQRNGLQALTADSGNSSSMTGTVSVALFFVESNGTVDPDQYTWNAEDEQSVLNQTQQAFAFWSQQATAYGSNVNFHIIPYFSTAPESQQPFEPILHPGTDDGLWVNAIMSNLGFTVGSKLDRVTSFNSLLRSSQRTDWAFSIFVGYNPAPAPSRFADGRFAFAYCGGPYVQALFNNASWGPDRFINVIAHETGHIFWACDEYGVCNASTTCFHQGPRPEAINGNCINDNPDSEPCLMREDVFHICPSTARQVGWNPQAENDSCDTPIDLISNSGTMIRDTSLTTSDGIDPVPDCEKQNAEKSVWYRFTAPTDGILNLDTLQSRYDTVLAAYTGSCGAMAAIRNGCNDDAQNGMQSQLSLPVDAGTTYYLEVAANNNDGGESFLNYEFEATPAPIVSYDFNQGMLNWIPKSGKWQAQSDGLIADSNSTALIVAPPSQLSGLTDYTVVVDLSLESTKAVVSLLSWYQDSKNNVEISLGSKVNLLNFVQRSAGKVVAKDKIVTALSIQTTYRLKVSYHDFLFSVWLDGSLILTVPTNYTPYGNLGLKVVGRSATAAFQIGRAHV